MGGAEGAGSEVIASARSAPSGPGPGAASPVHRQPVGRRTAVPDLTGLQERLGRGFGDEACWSRRCPTGRGAPKRAACPPTSGSSSWATPCSDWWWPSTATGRIREMPEGALAKVRAAVVNTTVLAEVALELDLGPSCCSAGARTSSGGRAKASILANAVEAVIGAVYLDGGVGRRRRSSCGMLDHRIEQAAAGPGAEDFKTRLQEMVSAGWERCPATRWRAPVPTTPAATRPACSWPAPSGAQGEGRSKKDAEQAAARVACAVLRPTSRPGRRRPSTPAPASASIRALRAGRAHHA